MLFNNSKISFIDSVSPRSGLMPPSTETLLRNCHQDIQSVLEVWGIISYPHDQNGDPSTPLPDSPLSTLDESYESTKQLGHGLRDASYSSLNTQQQHRYDAVTIDMLTLLEVSTKAISSIRTYSIHAPLLSIEALSVHRQAALQLIEALSVLEHKSRHLDVDEDEDEEDEDEGNGEYSYASLSFGDLEHERQEMKRYLAVVQEHLFKPSTERIETQLEQLLISAVSRRAGVTTGPEGVGGDGVPKSGLPKWIKDEEWSAQEDGESSLGKAKKSKQTSTHREKKRKVRVLSVC